MGRLVNEGDGVYEHVNSFMKIVVVNKQPHLCLFALREILPGMELRYDYGNPDQEWRKVRDLSISSKTDLELVYSQLSRYTQ